MGSLAQFSSPNKQKMIENNQNKIPEYAREYKRECQYIRGINKKCGEFLMTLDFGGDLFNSLKANSLKCHIKIFLKAQERGQLKDISGFYLNILMLITLKF